MASPSVLSRLRRRARALTNRAHVPFSKEPSAAVVLLNDGTWVPGVRVESASFSLTLPALLNAYTTVVAAARAPDAVAFVSSRPFRREEQIYLDQLPQGPFRAHADDAWIQDESSETSPFLPPSSILSPFLDQTVSSVKEGVRIAQRISDRAYVPSSSFPVGAVLAPKDERPIPGVNVEHPDWARILCAERNALGTAYSYGVRALIRLFLSCPHDAAGTPCGACRQLLAERAPDLDLWMDRHEAAPERANMSSLLPGSFRGRALLGSR